MPRLPFSLDAEFRGVARQPREYTDRDTGELRQSQPRLLFEYEAGGQVENVEISGSQLDRADGGVDYSKLKRGQFVRIEGSVVWRGDGSEPFLSLTSVTPAAGS